MANQARPKIVMQVELRMGATDRLREVADVIIDPQWEAVAGADVLVPGPGKVDAAMIERSGPNLKLIAKPGIGVDNIDIAAATARQVLVINTPDAPTESTAEHAVALLMAVAKRVVVGDMYLRTDRSIPREEMLGTELLGRTLGVIGYGRIGRRVAEICGLGLRMNVLAYDPYINLNQSPPIGITFTNDLDGLLSQSQFITVHVPLGANTRHFIGEREMRLMPKGSYLINASRGPVIDEAALIRLLQAGHFAGAGLDVFDPEPPHEDNPLLKMRNVVVTPHIASSTDRGIYAMMHGVADQVIQLLNGERPPYLLNPEVWPGRVKV